MFQIFSTAQCLKWFILIPWNTQPENKKANTREFQEIICRISGNSIVVHISPLIFDTSHPFAIAKFVLLQILPNPTC